MRALIRPLPPPPSRWQETDYRDFRVNFIQFMRNPPVENDDFEVSSADSTSEVPAGAEEKQMTVEDLPRPVMVSAIVYEDNSSTPCDASAGSSENGVCAWTVEGSEGKEASAAIVSSSSSSTTVADEIVESDIEARVLAAAAAAATAVAASNNVATAAPAAAAVTTSGVKVEFSPPAPVTQVVEASEAAAAVFCSSATEQAPRPAPALPAVVCDASDYTVGDEDDGSTEAADGGGCWDEQETNCRVPPCLTWAPADGAERAARDEVEEEEEEEEGDDNTVRVRRSFSNLETARRLGAGRFRAATGEDPTDSDDGGEEGTLQSRPRALSLDGWFTCGLENGVETKSYETHDHAGRLRELVTLVSFGPVLLLRTPFMGFNCPCHTSLGTKKPSACTRQWEQCWMLSEAPNVLSPLCSSCQHA